MRVRKLSALFGAALIFGGCIVLYLIMDVSLFPSVSQEENKWIHLENRLNRLEKNLNKHHEAVGQIKHTIIHLIRNSSFPLPIHGQDKSTFQPVSDISAQQVTQMTCDLQMDSVPNTDIQMLEVYKELKFDNLDGGVWKQGWNIGYKDQQWTNQNKLRVFVVPHSHNDPGWIKTFEDYYRSQTRNILNNMVPKLKEDMRRKFIWAEISFFSMWWDEITTDIREDVKRLVDNGQLEIVTGGWVMNDEANTHYFAMLQQMIEGHQWLEANLGLKPTNSWSIDPFGQSPAMAYLLKRSGLENLVIQRVHYSVKKYLAREKSLDFRWRQLWDGSGSTDLLSHMMPFYSYDVPHTCGPDPKVCCQFDFRRLPGYGLSCPWKSSPQIITKKNVAYRAELLLDQYRKKAQLYRTNVVLAPLGDDFRYDHASEWDAQYTNYQKIFDHLNSNPRLHVQAQFGTLKDFFGALRAEKPPESFPTLSGDFFTYADRDDHYWSGYYTSRPFYKRMDRLLVMYIRAADILFTLAYGSKPSSDWLLGPEWGLTKLLSDARQSLSLFQHHDGITGTARDNVVEDYARKMLEAIKGAQHVIQQSAHFLLSPSQPAYDPTPESVFFDLDDSRKHHYSLPEKTILTIGEGIESKKIVLFNSLAFRRQELVTVRVTQPHIKISNADGKTIESQTNLVFLQSTVLASTHFDVSFVVDVPPLGLATYFVHASAVSEPHISNTLARVKVMNFVGELPVLDGFSLEVVDDPKDFSIRNTHLMAAFTKQGFLKAISLDSDSFVLPLHLDFARYLARPGDERSGAYLFLPDGEAVALTVDAPMVAISEGPLMSQVKVYLPGLQHTITLYNTPGADSLGIEIHNLVDISLQNNYELVMRLSSNIQNGDEFFTDLNALQMIRRKRFPKLPLQANYYPLPSLAYIEDKVSRLTVLTAQPQGMGSLKEGRIELMQDRRLNQDDNRGLGQGVTDNLSTLTSYRILLEKRQEECQGTADNHPAGFPSIAAHVSLLSLLNPTLRLIWLGTSSDHLEHSYTPLAKQQGHDVHVVLMRAFTEPNPHTAGIILHRQQVDKCFRSLIHLSVNNGMVNISSLLPHQFGSTMRQSSLTFMHSQSTSLQKNSPQPLCAMEMAAYTFPR